MSAVNPVAAYAPTNCTTTSGSAYKNQIDSNSVSAQRIVNRFAPHAAASPNMTVLIDPGSIFSGLTLTEVAQQTTAAFTAPVNYPRIDRVVIDNLTGATLVVPGQEASSPVPPAIPNGKSPVAQVYLTTSTTAITNAAITDERNFGALATGGFGAQSSIGSASTCDLGTILSRNALVTGMTTITSFGASANTQSPIYLLEFASTLTLKSGSALALPGGKDISASAGDTAMAEYLGSGNWRVRDYTRAAGGSSLPTGTSVPWNGLFEPSWGKFENGQALSRTAYPGLLAALTGTVSGTTSNGSATVSSVGTDLTGLGIEGAAIEGSGIPASTTIVSITSNTITLSQAATGASGPLQIFPHGNGDGSTTFNVPDSRGRAVFGRDNMGGTAASRLTGQPGSVAGSRLGATGGEELHTLVQNEAPSYNIPLPLKSVSSGAGAGGNAYVATGAGLSVNSGGGGQGHNNVPPSIVKNWVIVT